MIMRHKYGQLAAALETRSKTDSQFELVYKELGLARWVRREQAPLLIDQLEALVLDPDSYNAFRHFYIIRAGQLEFAEGKGEEPLSFCMGEGQFFNGQLMRRGKTYFKARARPPGVFLAMVPEPAFLKFIQPGLEAQLALKEEAVSRGLFWPVLKVPQIGAINVFFRLACPLECLPASSVFKKGESVNGLYLVIKGDFLLFESKGIMTRRRVIGEGNIFGEKEVLEGQDARKGEARAGSSICQCILIPLTFFNLMLAKYP
jgi:CRP-like cAMP-binding protein